MTVATATAQPSQTQPSTQPTLERVALPTNGRGVLAGMTESGKSTLAEALIAQFLRQHGRSAQVLILDSKPRFRAEWEVSGLSAAHRYRKWGYGQPFPDSVVLPLNDPSAEMKAAWRMKHRVVIAQGDLATLDWLLYAADRFYHDATNRTKRLLYVDEVADYFGGTGLTTRGNPILKVYRSGREKGVAALAASQRPKGIPKSLLTETTCLYLFRLPFEADLEHLREMGLPEELDSPRAEHAFWFYNRKAPDRAGVYRLARPQTTGETTGNARTT